MKEFLTFQRFNNKDLAEDLVKFLREKGILYEVEEYSATYDATLGVERPQDISVKIMKEDFDEVNDLLLKNSSIDINSVAKDYYLFDFSDEELVEIITKPDEWSYYDYSLASQLLKNRGKEITPELASVLRKNRVQELSKPETGTKIWIILGYGSSLMGGVLGVFMGIHMATYKKILPNGDKVYGFQESDRKHGVVIASIGILVIVIVAVVKAIELAQ